MPKNDFEFFIELDEVSAEFESTNFKFLRAAKRQMLLRPGGILQKPETVKSSRPYRAKKKVHALLFSR